LPVFLIIMTAKLRRVDLVGRYLACSVKVEVPLLSGR
jgi:hypothetical protein